MCIILCLGIRGWLFTFKTCEVSRQHGHIMVISCCDNTVINTHIILIVIITSNNSQFIRQYASVQNHTYLELILTTYITIHLLTLIDSIYTNNHSHQSTQLNQDNGRILTKQDTTVWAGYCWNSIQNQNIQEFRWIFVVIWYYQSLSDELCLLLFLNHPYQQYPSLSWINCVDWCEWLFVYIESNECQ